MRSYFGLVDDFAERHGDLAIKSVPNLTQNLIFAVLFDEPLLINDGHVIASAVIRKALSDPEKSPLRKLIEAGFVQILTRNGRKLGELTQHMADNGIVSAQELLKDRRHRAFRPILSEWAQTLNKKDLDGEYLSFHDWPVYNTSEIFERLALAALAQAISNAEDETFKRQLLRFGGVFRDSPQRNRTTWEKEVSRLRREDKLSNGLDQTLLRIANESYQYSWGCALSAGPVPVKVFTRTPEFLAIDHAVAMSDVPRRKKVLVYAPNFCHAEKKVKKDDWEALAEVAQPGHKFSDAKHEFITTLAAYYTSPDVTQEEMDTRADEYSKALAMHFGGERVPFAFDLTFTGLSAAAGLAAGGPIGAAVGLGVGFIGNIAAHMGGPKFIQRCVLPLERKWIRSGRNIQSTSFFQVEAETAAAFLRGVSKYNP